MMPIPASSSSQGAKLPTAESSLPGRPKIAAPIMPLRASNAAPQIPTSRLVAGCGSSAMDEARCQWRVVSQDSGRAGALEGEQGFKDQRVALTGPGGGRGLDH